MTVRPPLCVEYASDPSGRVAMLLYSDLFTGPDGVTKVISLRRRATGDALGEAVLALIAERDTLLERVMELESKVENRKRFVRKE